MRRHLILIANTYPYSGSVENSFINPEIPYLLDTFDTVRVAPERLEGNRLDMDSRVLLDVSLAEILRKPKLIIILRGILSVEFLKEILGYPWLLLHWKMLARVSLFSGRAQLVTGWLKNLLSDRGLIDREVVIYMFWFAHSAFGCSLLRKNMPKLKVVSRAHGDDLYEGRHRPQYIPFRKNALCLIDYVFPDSEAGVKYLRSRWPDAGEKIALARLGVENPGCEAHQSSDGVLRLVTCSSLTGVKRVHLVIDGLAELARIRPSLHIEWNHFGDGQLRLMIENAAAMLSPKISWRFHGHVSSGRIRSWYNEQSVDVFVNVSSSEGTPVSIMEAISYGIPIIATAVGGNCEIVDENNGLLIPPNPTASDLANALVYFTGATEELSQLRSGSRLVWESKYDAARNYYKYALELQKI
jgi:colanic acid/amylovoran biosynthesis glycosyltransferase